MCQKPTAATSDSNDGLGAPTPDYYLMWTASQYELKAALDRCDQYRVALKNLREGMENAPNPNIVDYIDAVLADA
jgi:hypothetical protein